MNSYKNEVAAFLEEQPGFAKYRKKRLLKLFFKMLFSTLAILALTVFLYFQTTQIAILIIGILLALFAVFKIADPRKNFSKQYGRITEISVVQKRVINKNGMMNSYTAMMDAIVLIVKLEAPSGREYKMELDDSYQNVIKVGDILLRLPGVPYPITRSPHEMVTCPCCGNIMPRETLNCVNCGCENIYHQT